MSDIWDQGPLAPAVAPPQRSNAWDSAPLAGPTPQQRAVVSANDNAEEAARALAVSKKINVPAPIVQSDLPGYVAHDRTESAKRASDNPAIAKYIQGNPMAASVSGDDWDGLEEASQTLRALHPELFAKQVNGGLIGAVPEIASMAQTAEGRDKMFSALKKLPKALAEGALDFFKTPGNVVSGAIDLTTAEGLDKGISFGLGVALGGRDVRVGKPARIEVTGGDYMSFDDFMHKLEGLKTREEIDAFLASRQPGPPGAMLQITKAEAGAAALDKAVEVAQNSKTKARSPELFAEFGNAHDAGEVHLDAGKILELYQKEGKVPAAGDGLFGFVPDLSAKVHAAAATGGEISIPIGSYIAHVDPAVHEGLRDSVRLHNDGVTLEEAKEVEASIEAYHGTPHDFEQFDLTKIGTGEGAQVYGHGLYFAENKAVGQEYSDRLGAKTGYYDVDAEKYIIPKGQLYKVSINADPTKFLDWDKPFGEQSSEIQAIIQKLQAEHDLPFHPELNKDVVTGEQIYGHLKDVLATHKKGVPDKNGFYRMDDGREAASRALAEAGIPGIKYLDQGSRKPPSEIHQDELSGKFFVTEEGVQGATLGPFDTRAEAQAAIPKESVNKTRNFVVFDDKLVKITEKNGNPVIDAVTASAEQQKRVLYLNGLFKDAASVGLTEPEFKRYSDKIERAEAYVLERAVRLNRGKIAQSVSAEWKRNEATVRDEVTTELTNTGRYAVAKFQADNKIVIDPANADSLAPLFGYDTGAELLAGIDAVNLSQAATGKNWRTQQRDAIKTETAARMEERYGRLAENIAQEAREIALADHSFDIMAEEVSILAKLAKATPPLSRDEMVAWAKQNFEGSTVADGANYDKLQRAVAKGGREAEKALLKGDFVEAFQAKQRQMLAATLAKESLALQRVIDRVEAKIDRFSSEQVIKGIDQEYLEQIREMLGAVGVSQTHLPMSEPMALRDFVAASENQLAVAPWLFDRPPAIKDMSVAEFREFADSLKSMEHVGRQAKTLASAQEKAELQNVIFDIKAENARFNLIEQPLNPTVGQRLKSFGRWITATHLLVERMLDYTDKFNPEGPLTKWLDRPLRDSNAKEIQLTERVSKDLRALRQYTDSSVNDLIPNKVIPDTLTTTGFMNLDRGNLRQLALLMGARENIVKVVEGFGVNEADVRKLLHDNMTEKDWKWVQGMWDIHDVLHKEANEMVTRDTGVPLESKTPVPLTTKFGERSGGYAPLVYDRSRSNIQGDIAAKNPIFEPEYFSTMTAHGYTQQLTQYSGPLDLTGSFIASKIQTMIHDIAFREAIRNASKLINNAEFMADMTQKWSREYAGLLPGWLRDIANVRNIDDSYAMGAQRVAAGMRQNITAALIAFNPGTYIKHGTTALSMSVERVGAMNFAAAMKDLGIRSAVENLRDLVQSTDARPGEDFVDALREVTDTGMKGEAAREFILASSAVMRNRQRKFEDSIRGAYEVASEAGVVQTAKNFRHAAMNLGRTPVALSDAVSAMPTWLASYKAATLAGAEHADAVFQADKDVSRAHGSNFVGDKPRVLRTGETMRWITPLYNFWNHMANNYFQAAWDMASNARGQAEPNATVRNYSNRLFWLVVIPLIVEEMAGPAKDEHGDTLGLQALKAIGRHFGASIIGLRDFTNFALTGYEPSVGLVGTVLQTMKQAKGDIAKVASGQTTNNGIAHAFTALGMLTGVGGSAPGKAAQFGAEIARGRDRPQTFNDYRQGLRTGHSKARKLQ